MFNYRGVYIWHNDLRNAWMLQVGHEIIGQAETIGAAKCKATWYAKKN